MVSTNQQKRTLRSFITPIRSRGKHGGLLWGFLFLLAGVTLLMWEKAIMVNLGSTAAGAWSQHPSTTLAAVSAAAAAAAAFGRFGHIFKLTGRAEQWSLWNANDPTTSPLSRDDVSCEWTAFTPFGRPENTARMCTYNVATDRFVSDEIKRNGHWYDCNDLVGLWKEANEKYQQGASSSLAASISSSRKTAIYLDVGGNIGSCVMEMLQSTDAKIVVFEPHPHNLAQITTTIKGQPENVRKRVIVFPVGVGDVTGNFTMHMSTNNRGHSVVGETAVQEFSGQTFLTAASIYIERLDDIFNVDEVVIPLLKMDIQGFECKALDGMKSLLSKVDIITTEGDALLLGRQGCSVEGLISRITNAGLQVKVNGNDMIARRIHAQQQS